MLLLLLLLLIAQICTMTINCTEKNMSYNFSFFFLISSSFFLGYTIFSFHITLIIYCHSTNLCSLIIIIIIEKKHEGFMKRVYNLN